MAEPTSKAMQTAIDKAFDLFYNRNYAKAAKAFEALIEASDLDLFKKQRLDAFHKMTHRATAKPGMSDDPALVDVAAMINAQQYEEALDVLEKLELKKECVLFLKAEIAAEQGDSRQAAEFLKKAADINAETRGYAKNSPAIRRMASRPEFSFLRT